MNRRKLLWGAFAVASQIVCYLALVALLLALYFGAGPTVRGWLS